MSNPPFNDSDTARREGAFLQSEAKPQVVSAAKGNMVALPGQLFYSTQIPVCLWFLPKNKAADAKRGFRCKSDAAGEVRRKTEASRVSPKNLLATSIHQLLVGTRSRLFQNQLSAQSNTNEKASAPI